MGFRYLSTLGLKTYGKLVDTLADRRQELDMIHHWLRDGQIESYDDHPALERIGFWYGGCIDEGDMSSGVLTLWVKLHSSAWRRVEAHYDCPHTRLF